MYAAISLYPFLWMVSGAFKGRTEILQGGHLIPHRPTLATLVDTWSRLHFFEYFRNSLQRHRLTVLGVLVVYSLASYAFAMLELPRAGGAVLVLRRAAVRPGITVLLPVTILEKELGILGTHAGLILPFVNGTAPLAVLHADQRLPRRAAGPARRGPRRRRRRVADLLAGLPAAGPADPDHDRAC